MALAPTAQLASGSNLSFTPSNLMCCLEGPSELVTAALKRMTKPICPIHSMYDGVVASGESCAARGYTKYFTDDQCFTGTGVWLDHDPYHRMLLRTAENKTYHDFAREHNQTYEHGQSVMRWDVCMHRDVSPPPSSSSHAPPPASYATWWRRRHTRDRDEDSYASALEPHHLALQPPVVVHPADVGSLQPVAVPRVLPENADDSVHSSSCSSAPTVAYAFLATSNLPLWSIVWSDYLSSCPPARRYPSCIPRAAR